MKPENQPNDLNKDLDIIIVGAGAAGAAAAWRLAAGGLKVACLERGDWQKDGDFPANETDWEIKRQTCWSPNPTQRRLTFDLQIDAEDSEIKPLMYSAVGGSTIMWSCHFPRFHPSDFCTRTMDGVGEDWPISYQDLLPYYQLNEKMMGVSGLSGNTAYPIDAPHRLPPLPLSEGAKRIANAFNELGWSWWPAEMAVNSQPYGSERGQCNHCGPCELNCPHKAKASTDITYWPLAIKAGARLFTKTRVTKILTDPSNLVSGVLYLDRTGKEERLLAPRVLLACNAVGSARLLKLSADKTQHKGLANKSSLVGKNLMLHPLARVSGLFEDLVEGHKGISAGSFVSHHFYETDGKRDFKRGFKMQALGTHGPALTASGSAGRRIAWGNNHHNDFLRHFGHVYSLSICSDDMPDLANQVVLSETNIADDGLPAARMIYKTPVSAKKALKMGMKMAKKALLQAGCYEIFDNPSLPEAGFHLMGTARMGNNPEKSVLNKWCETHDVQGLFVIDGSAFVTAAAVNPTNTIQAIALRTADYLIAKK